MKVHRLLGDRIGRDILMLSVSIDPEHDTPEALNRYWERYGSKPGWIYLTGDYDEIDELRRSMGVYDLDPVIDADRTQHAGLITFGNDRTNRWSALPALMDVPGIAETILRITRDNNRNRVTGLSQLVPELHSGRGIIRDVNKAQGQVVIDHDEIPGLMMAMKMDFDIPPTLLGSLSPGQQVDFSVKQSEGRFQIVQIDISD